MNTYSASHEPDYDWCGEESGYRGHSHIVTCESPDGRTGRAYANGDNFEAWEIEELCEEAEENLK